MKPGAVLREGQAREAARISFLGGARGREDARVFAARTLRLYRRVMDDWWSGVRAGAEGDVRVERLGYGAPLLGRVGHGLEILGTDPRDVSLHVQAYRRDRDAVVAWLNGDGRLGLDPPRRDAGLPEDWGYTCIMKL